MTHGSDLFPDFGQFLRDDPAWLDDAALEALPFAKSAAKHDWREPDWAMVHRELKCAGATQRLLWEEYRATKPNGYIGASSHEIFRVRLGTIRAMC